MLVNLSAILAYVVVVSAVLLRVGAGTGAFATKGFGLVGASLLFFGANIPRKHFWIPVTLLIGSDIYLNVWQYQSPITLDQYIMWAWYLVPCVFGFFLRDKIKPFTVLGAGLGTGIGFYLASNFCVWAFGSIGYAKNLSGLVECYARAIPFFRNGIVGDVLFSAVFFSIPVLYAYTVRVTANKSAAA
jgi:hypothetical protein